MRLATWNINSIRARIDRAVDFLHREDIDVLALQETKCRPDQFPAAALEEMGYEVHAVGYDQWNGVALVSRLPLTDIRIGFPGQPTWTKKGKEAVVEARAIGATVHPEDGEPFDVWSLYIPNGRELGDPHYDYKLEFLEALRQYVASARQEDPDAQIMLVGDWNIAPLDEDVWDPAFFEGRTHVSPPERAAFNALLDDGVHEVTRDRVDGYTYWDYQQLRFPRNEGMRIDFILATPPLEERVTGAEIDRNERKGRGASDHVPVIVDVDEDWMRF